MATEHPLPQPAVTSGTVLSFSRRNQLNNKHNVLFLRGLNDDGYVKIVKITNKNQLLYNCKGSCNVFDHTNSEGFNKQLITLDANKLQDINYADCDLVFNQIADADTHKISLSKTNELVKALNADPAATRVECINHPLNILRTTRDTLHSHISKISGVSVPECIRVSQLSAEQIKHRLVELDWSYPVIIRHCGDHNGRHMSRLDKVEDIDKLSYTYFETDCYLTQFIDYADDQGLYRKLRIVVVDGEFTIRHVLYNENWRVSSDARVCMKKNSWLFEHEKKFIESFESDIKPAITDTISSIHKKIGLDYYGIDCALDTNMNLLIFEINPNMNILFNSAPRPSIWSPCISLIKTYLSEMISRRLSVT